MKLVEKISSAANPESGIDSLKETLNEVAAEVGLGLFAYLDVPLYKRSTTKPLLISSYPKDWTDYYLANQFERIDPVIRTAMSGHLPFFWGTEGVQPQTPSEKSFFDEAAAFGIEYGWTVPVHDLRGQVATLNFSSCGNFKEFKGNIEREFLELHLLAIYLHEAVVKTKVSTADTKTLLTLTSREIETLQWAARGKSRIDTAQIIGISPRTVKFHLESAMRKLDVATTRQAVLRAALSGLIADDS